MERAIYKRTYREGDAFAVFLASDLHCDDIAFDADLFRADMERARATGARVYLNGDVLGLILPGDLKRYTPSADTASGIDAKVNIAVERAEAILAPYVDMIDIIGTGNHETAILKHCSVDATRLLVGFLNRRRDPKLPPIKHGGYMGFVRLQFAERDGGHTQQYDIFYNHGQGGGAEVSRGMIDLQRRQYISADLIWLGHKHKQIATMLDPEIGMSANGRIYERPKRGVITGTYLANFAETDASADGYKLSFQEERQRVPQGRGGALLRLTVRRSGITARVET